MTLNLGQVAQRHPFCKGRSPLPPTGPGFVDFPAGEDAVVRVVQSDGQNSMHAVYIM